jgi:uncharacterized protein involved in exopolysaccharide biosynthesis
MVEAGMETSAQEKSIAVERARELLHHSSDSVESELERVRGWLQSAHLGRQSGYWEVEAVAGGIGALSNAWGRLTLWSRANGTYDAVQDELASIMEQLVEIHHQLMTAPAGERELQALEKTFDRLQHVYQTVQAGDPAES